jgi:hypothetical protein
MNPMTTLVRRSVYCTLGSADFLKIVKRLGPNALPYHCCKDREMKWFFQMASNADSNNLSSE